MSSLQFADNFLQRLKADGLLRPQERVLVALSGGSDSVALLHLLRSAAAPLQLSLFAAHLDHGIRPQSCHDADFVRELCSQLQIPLSCERVDIPAFAAAKKVGLEEAGRMARQAFLCSTAERFDCTAIALGHHRGDQAETLLHHLVRGCGLHGLTGMRSRHGLFIRPLLPYSKAELLAYLVAIGAQHVVDSSNDDPIFTRNRIRHQLLPLFSSFNPRIEGALASLGGVAAQEDDYWQVEMERLDALLVRRDSDILHLGLAGLLSLHPAQRFRFLHHLLLPFARRGGKEVGLRHVEALDLLLKSATPQGEVHLPGVRALRRYDQITLSVGALSAASPWSLELVGPGSYLLPSGGELRVVGAAGGQGEGGEVAEFSAELSFPLTVRSVQPGDRIRLAGLAGKKRLKGLMAEYKIPLEERRTLAILEKDEILWVVGVRRSSHFLPQEGKGVWRVIHVPHKSREILEMP